jgi:serine protease Do
LAESLGLDRAVGALVSQVYDNTPAREGGLMPGDLILQYEARDIIRFSDLAPLVGATRPGHEAELKIVRNGEEQLLTLVIGALPADGGMQLGQARPKPEPVDPENPLNVVVRDLTADQQRIFTDGGVEVVEVFAGPAQEAGLRVGDVITMVHGSFVTSAEDFQQKMDRLPSNRRIALRIVRDGTTRFISVAIR